MESGFSDSRLDRERRRILVIEDEKINRMILGNILEPRIEGKNLGISPVAILISLSVWGYIWGFTGMLLAVPLTVIIKIICENLDYMKGAAIFLGNDPRQSNSNKTAD